jgi:hypothetical protein
LLTEVFTPGVSYSPVFGAILNTIAYDRDIVNDVLVTGLIFKDTRGVVLKSIRDSDTTSNGTSLVNLLHHSLLSRDFAILVNLVSVVGVGYEAALSGHAVLTLEHGAALGAIIVSTSSVDRAGFVGNIVVVHPLESVISFTTMATIIS